MSKGAFETLTLAGPFHKRLYRADGTILGVWNTGFQFQVFSRPVGELMFPVQGSVDVPPALSGSSLAAVCSQWELKSGFLFTVSSPIQVWPSGLSVSTQKDEAGE